MYCFVKWCFAKIYFAYLLSLQMIKTLSIFILLVVCFSKEKQVYELLQHSQSINYTFYHLHQYPKNDRYGLLISIKQLDSNVEEVRQRIAQNYNKIVAALVPYGFEANITSKTEDYDKKLQIQWTLQILAGNNTTAFGLFLDQIANLSKNSDLYIWSVFRHGREIIDKQIQKTKAREKATDKSKKVCEEHIGWSFKQIAAFDEIAIQNKKSEQIVIGEYLQVLESIQEKEQSNPESTIYKCQIICERKNNIDLSVIQKVKNKKTKKSSKKKHKESKKGNKKEKKNKKKAKKA